MSVCVSAAGADSKFSTVCACVITHCSSLVISNYSSLDDPP